MITGKNLKQDICKCKCKFDGRIFNSYQKWNNDKCWWECNIIYVTEIISVMLLYVVAKMVNI